MFTYDPLNRLSSAQNTGTDCTVNVLGSMKKFWATRTRTTRGQPARQDRDQVFGGEPLRDNLEAHGFGHRYQIEMACVKLVGNIIADD